MRGGCVEVLIYTLWASDQLGLRPATEVSSSSAHRGRPLGPSLSSPSTHGGQCIEAVPWAPLCPPYPLMGAQCIEAVPWAPLCPPYPLMGPSV
jgi:hypothetical protein